MNISYEGIGQWAATFACAGVKEGDLVKISDNHTVSTCEDGDAFCGTVLSVSRDGQACSVALGGAVTVPYSGTTAPKAGWDNLVSDTADGVKSDSTGRKFLVLDVDTAGKRVTFVL